MLVILANISTNTGADELRPDAVSAFLIQNNNAVISDWRSHRLEHDRNLSSLHAYRLGILYASKALCE